MTESAFVTSQHPAVVRVVGDDPAARGRARGRALATETGPLAAAYRELFTRAARHSEFDPDAALARTRAATLAWWPEVGDELAAIADAAGVSDDELWLLNARTELLAEARRAGAPSGYECSVAVTLEPTSTLGLQTWDWYEHLAEFWHPISVAGVGTRAWCGISEAGILGKIGLNDAGIAVHFDILFHRDDRAGGVPVHLVATRILAECGNLDDAIELACTAPVSASTALTLHDGRRAATIELSPAGAARIDPHTDRLVHANRFLASHLAAAEWDDPNDPEATTDAIGRTALLRERVEALTAGPTRDALAACFATEPGDVGVLSCVPASSEASGERWHTLVTVATEPGARRLEWKSGVPGSAAPWRRFELEKVGATSEFRETATP